MTKARWAVVVLTCTVAAGFATAGCGGSVSPNRGQGGPSTASAPAGPTESLGPTESPTASSSQGSGSQLAQSPTGQPTSGAGGPTGAQYLSELHPTDGCTRGSEASEVNGETFYRNVELSSGCPMVEFNIGRKYSKLLGTIGMNDNSPSGSGFKVDIVADGHTLLSQTLGIGQSAPLNLDIQHVLRLRLSIAPTNINIGSAGLFEFGDIRAVSSGE
jgi:hypothetical protein